MNAASFALRVTAVVAVTLLAGHVAEMGARSAARRAVPMPGRMVDVGGHMVQVDCRGAGSPTIVLESGLDQLGTLAWAAVHDSLATTTRTCAYSRPGIMWSDARDAAFDSRSLARDLHDALELSGEHGPYVLAAHSIGGPYAVAFTTVYPKDVAGLVLVDPSHPAQFDHFKRVTGRSLRPTSTLPRVGAAVAWTGAVRLFPADDFADSTRRAASLAAARFLPSSVAELARELDAIPSTLATERASHDLGDRPVIVLSAAIGQSVDALHLQDLTIAEGHKLVREMQALHEEEAHWSTRGEHRVVSGATHYIQFDRPDAVIGAVRDVVSMVRGITSSR